MCYDHGEIELFTMKFHRIQELCGNFGRLKSKLFICTVYDHSYDFLKKSFLRTSLRRARRAQGTFGGL